MTSASPQPTPKPQSHFFQMPVVKETTRPAEPTSTGGTW